MGLATVMRLEAEEAEKRKNAKPPSTKPRKRMPRHLEGEMSGSSDDERQQEALFFQQQQYQQQSQSQPPLLRPRSNSSSASSSIADVVTLESVLAPAGSGSSPSMAELRDKVVQWIIAPPLLLCVQA
jgi:hypothetical protein